jgi:hypothetical protein
MYNATKIQHVSKLDYILELETECGHSQSGFKKGRNTQILPEIKPRVHDCPSHSLVTILAELSNGHH